MGVTLLFYTKIKNATRTEVKKVVVASAALQAGTSLSEQNTKLMDWPASVPLEGSSGAVADLNGRITLYPIDANEPIRLRDLAGVGSGPGLTAKIPEGMRAIAVRTNEVNNVGGFLYPGAHVDVLLTVNQQGGGALTQTVLQDVQILTVGQKSEPNPDQKPEDAKVVTLLASPEDSQKLVLASNHGTLQLVLRNGSDNKKTNTPSVSSGELIGGPRPVVAAMGPAKRREAQVQRPPAYTVETIAGGKRAVSTFEQPATGGKPKK